VMKTAAQDDGERRTQFGQTENSLRRAPMRRRLNCPHGSACAACFEFVLHLGSFPCWLCS
jgi:hypothetical protein